MNTTGEPISAEEAYEYGLVNRVVADHELFDTALAWARKFARQAPLALEQIKRVSHRRPRRGHRGREGRLRRGLRLRGRARGHRRVPRQAHAEVQGRLSGSSHASRGLAELIRSAGSVVALTGAGISVPSGIPDFRSPGTGPVGERRPDGGRPHLGLAPRPRALLVLLRAALRDAGRQAAQRRAPRARGARAPRVLDAVITQNIDGLHAAAGTRDLIEVHGSIATSSCLACGARVELAERARLDARPRTACRAATAARRSSPTSCCSASCCRRRRWRAPRRWRPRADVLLCVGSSLEVYPVAELPRSRCGAGGAVGAGHDGPDAVRRRRGGRLDGDVVAELGQGRAGGDV